MLRYDAHTTADPATAWALYARPAQWSSWAPQLRGAWGLGEPEVRPGARGAARLLGVVPVPATILGKDDGRSWTWRVGPVTLGHHVEPDDGAGGCTVAVTLSAAPPVESLLRATYGPVCALLMRNLARVAASRSPRASPATSAP